MNGKEKGGERRLLPIMASGKRGRLTICNLTKLKYSGKWPHKYTHSSTHTHTHRLKPQRACVLGPCPTPNTPLREGHHSDPPPPQWGRPIKMQNHSPTALTSPPASVNFSLLPPLLPPPSHFFVCFYVFFLKMLVSRTRRETADRRGEIAVIVFHFDDVISAVVVAQRKFFLSIEKSQL